MSESTKGSKVKIVVLQRGWVVVGKTSKDGSNVRVDNGAVVRRWGTTKGLGEIAEKGPMQNTVLDKCGTVRSHELAVVMTIDCNDEAWANKLVA